MKIVIKKINQWFLLFTILILFFAVLAFCFSKSVKSAYLEWGLAELIIEYSELHDGVPPKCWSDLKKTFIKAGNLSSVRSTEELQLIVSIDFDKLNDVATASPNDVGSCFVRSWYELPIHVVDTNRILKNYYQSGIIPVSVVRRISNKGKP